MKLIIQALLLLLMANLLPGVHLSGFVTAVLVLLLFTILNATIGLILKFFSLPLTFLTFGLFTFVINAAMLQLTSAFFSGFSITFSAAFVVAVVLAIVSGILELWVK